LTNSFRILFASSIAAMKSPTLKPKLIVMSSTALLLAQEKVGKRRVEGEKVESERRLSYGFASTLSALSLTRLDCAR
jgi:hypothetical protein